MARRALGPAALQIVQAVIAWVQHEPDDTHVVIACSGGADSLALLAAAAHLVERGRTRARVRCVTVDHQLQAGSDQVAVRVCAAAADLGVPCEIVRVDVLDAGQGPEAAAREARYAALEATAAPVILLGHTLDDQAEQVLLALARGSGTRSIAGMPARRGVFARPLLHITRAITHQACVEWGLSPWEDPHNTDARFLRSRVRHDLMPTLAEVLGPHTVTNLARTAELARADADLLDDLASHELQHLLMSGRTLPCDGLVRLHPALRSRVVRWWLQQWGVSAPASQIVTGVLALVTDWRGQRGVDVPGATVTRSAGQLRVEPHSDQRSGTPNADT